MPIEMVVTAAAPFRKPRRDAAALPDGKSKALAAKMKEMGWTSALFIDGQQVDEGFARAAANIKHVDVLPSQGANVYDILRRYLEWTGLSVRMVSNITDIDDKIIDRANREGRPWQDITHKCENVWFEAMGKLNVARPTDVPHATEYVDQMVDMIATLVSRDRAYVTSDGVYLSVTSVDDYGLLAHQKLEDMLAGGGERAAHHPPRSEPAEAFGHVALVDAFGRNRVLNRHRGGDTESGEQ